MVQPVTLRLSSLTHRGCVRASNEDRALVRPLPRGAFFGVCDGMGGARGGEVASTVTVETLDEAASAEPPSTADSAARLVVAALRTASRRVHTLSKVRHPVDLEGMGTTASVAAIVPSTRSVRAVSGGAGGAPSARSKGNVAHGLAGSASITWPRPTRPRASRASRTRCGATSPTGCWSSAPGRCTSSARSARACAAA